MHTPYDINEHTKCKVFQEHQETLHPLKSNGLWWKKLEVKPSEISAESLRKECSDDKREYVKTDECKESYGYKNNITVSFNNTVAGLVKSCREFKEKAYGMMYDVGTWLEKIYKSVTKQAKAHNLNTQSTQAQHGKEVEMKELNHEYKQFKTPPIHPEARKISDAHSSDQVVVTQHISQGRQQG